MSDTVDEKRKRLVKVLSNNVNSGNVAEIIKAVEDFVDEKIRVALVKYEDDMNGFDEAHFDGEGF